MDKQTIIADEARYMMQTYRRADVVLARGEGVQQQVRQRVLHSPPRGCRRRRNSRPGWSRCSRVPDRSQVWSSAAS